MPTATAQSPSRQAPAVAPAAVPPHAEWPRATKSWLLYRLFVRRCHRWLSTQDVWERLLTDELHYSGGNAAPNPYGLTTGTPTATCYAVACQHAAAWEASGRPMPEMTAA